MHATIRRNTRMSAEASPQAAAPGENAAIALALAAYTVIEMLTLPRI